MRFIPKRKTEHGALGNHTDWIVVRTLNERTLIQCICHDGMSQDLRWVFTTQLVKETNK